MVASRGVIINLGFLLLGMTAVGFAGGTHRKPVEAAFLAPPKDLKYFSFGYNENIADSLWLRLIQDLDHCDTSHVDLESSPEAKTSVPLCENVDRGWVFHMLDGITEIAPKFRSPYAYGTVVLSVLVHDVEGARELFDRAVVQFPEDWTMQYKAAYHYLYEIKDQEKAAKLLTRAGKNGAPPWVFSLAAKLYSKENQKQLARSILQGEIDEQPDGPYADRFRMRLKEIEDEK
jgi:tetratricopeptide (TPR) repeat protein